MWWGKHPHLMSSWLPSWLAAVTALWRQPGHWKRIMGTPRVVFPQRTPRFIHNCEEGFSMEEWLQQKKTHSLSWNADVSSTRNATLGRMGRIMTNATLGWMGRIMTVLLSGVYLPRLKKERKMHCMTTTEQNVKSLSLERKLLPDARSRPFLLCDQRCPNQGLFPGYFPVRQRAPTQSFSLLFSRRCAVHIGNMFWQRCFGNQSSNSFLLITHPLDGHSMLGTFTRHEILPG